MKDKKEFNENSFIEGLVVGGFIIWAIMMLFK